MEFRRGRGSAKQKTFLGGGGEYGYFLGLHNELMQISMAKLVHFCDSTVIIILMASLVR